MQIECTGEDFEYHWNFLDYKGKSVLDLGADFGSTAKCFLHYGATKIYAVEQDSGNYLKLYLLSKTEPIVPIKLNIKSDEDFIRLFTDINVDIVKIDIETDEIHLTKLNSELLTKYNEYIIEVHTNDIKRHIIEKFNSLGSYELKLERPLNVDGITVLYFKKKMTD